MTVLLKMNWMQGIQKKTKNILGNEYHPLLGKTYVPSLPSDEHGDDLVLMEDKLKRLHWEAK
eukprot:6487792-Ditylum_brightwellii.AAC.1